MSRATALVLRGRASSRRAPCFTIRLGREIFMLLRSELIRVVFKPRSGKARTRVLLLIKTAEDGDLEFNVSAKEASAFYEWLSGRRVLLRPREYVVV
jgi:hypothetical protein